MKIERRYIPSISIGQMRDLVTLLVPTITTVTRNNKAVTYPVEDQIEVYAVVHPGGNERSLQEANFTYDDIITVYIRYNGNLANNWKIRYAGSDYTIHKVSNVDAVNRFQQIMCYSKKP